MQNGQHGPWVQAIIAKGSCSKNPSSAGPSSPRAAQASTLQPFGSEFYMVAAASSTGPPVPSIGSGMSSLPADAETSAREASVPRTLLSTTSTPQLSQQSTEAALREAASRSQSMQLEATIPIGRAASADQGVRDLVAILGRQVHTACFKSNT